MAEENLFKKLTTLFRSGPTIKRKVKQFKGSSAPSSLEMFKKAHSDVYNSTISAYGSYDRMARYSDFSEMESTPEICSALDIYSEECVAADSEGKVLHIFTENRKIKGLLENLFYDTLNIEFNLSMWVRNLCKYGDFFLFNDISPEYGVINAFPIPIAEIEREEGFDPDEMTAVRFRWVSQGNRVLENWQVSHFRLLGSDAFLPYGSSVLEGARRIWRQLILIEDAMLVYRIIRSPERRVFYIDVGNIPPENVADYLEQAQTSLKRNAVIDKTSGRVDLRYNPLSVDEDYFLPVRGGDSGTRIDSLAGGSNTTAIEDVEYIQKKLFSALKIPKAYLGYDEDIGSKATLAQEDIRFSRTIQRIQKTILSELNKLAMIHLYCHGYTGEDLLDFELRLSNPSSIAQQQKLELIRTKFEIAAQAPEGVVDRNWIRTHILDLSKDEIESVISSRKEDKLEDLELEAVRLPDADVEGEEGEGGGDAGGDLFGGGGGDTGGGLFGGGDDTGGDTAGAGGLFSGHMIDDDDLLEEDDELNEEDELEEAGKGKRSNNNSVKYANARKRGKKRVKKAKNKGQSGIPSVTVPSAKLSLPITPSAKSLVGNLGKLSLADSVLPQTNLMNDFIDRQITKFHGFEKTLDKMGSDLGINSSLKNSLITENNEEFELDDDIIMDRETKGNDNGEDS